MPDASNAEVNLPVIPDKVVDRIRAGKPVALEEVSEPAAELAASREAAKTQPLRAETLTPISRQRASQLMTGSPDGTFTRGVLPKAPVTRRVIPRPFARESISIRVPGEPVPVWRNLRAGQVRAGDIVPGAGKVVSVERVTRYSGAAEVVPVVREQPAAPGGELKTIIVTEFTAEDSAALLAAYGLTGERVATGVDVILTGQGGNTLVLDEEASVAVFGFDREAEDVPDHA